MTNEPFDETTTIIVNKIAAGDRIALEEFVHRYNWKMVRMADRYMRRLRTHLVTCDEIGRRVSIAIIMKLSAAVALNFALFRLGQSGIDENIQTDLGRILTNVAFAAAVVIAVQRAADAVL
jgi:hypothetical protein